jgi:CheY-like chemotaxis protein
MLENLGYRVEAMTGSTGALVRFRKAPGDYDLIITDLTMPVLTGDQLTDEVLAIRPDFPVILMTGYNDMPDSDRIKKAV